MKSIAQGAFKTNKNNRGQRQVAALVLGLLAVLLVLGCAFFLVPKRELANLTAPALSEDVPPYWAWLEADGPSTPQFEDTVRPVYAYSVIPGGVRSGKELRLALARDAIAAAHYKGFDTQAARPVRLKRARQIYLSYRLGNHIYWTSKKVRLHAGETLLTDGTHLVRGRCGNRISEVPAVPTSDGEPPEPVLSAPVLPHATAETVDLPLPPPIWAETPTSFVVAMAPAPGPASGGGPLIPPFPFVPCCGGTSGSHTPTLTPTPPPVIPQPEPEPGPSPNRPPSPPSPIPPPVAAPEPGTIELLLAGFVSAFVLLKLRRP